MAFSFNRSMLSRRAAVKTGVAAASASMAHWSFGAAAEPAARIITKPIPSTGERLPVIGVGTNAYGVAGAEGLAARREVLKRMPELGASVVDTAASYGRSEEVIGDIVEALGNRGRLFIATKLAEATPRAGLASIEASFFKLQTDRIDLMQIHSVRGVDATVPLLQEMKAARRIRYIGITSSSDRQHPVLAAALRKHQFDFVQVNYSIDDREAADLVLPVAQERGVAVLINVPFGGRRRSLFRRVVGKGLPPLAVEVGARSWAQFFLKYSISHPAVTCAIPGMTQVRHLEDNIQAGQGKLASPELRKEMEAYWDFLDA